MCIRDRLRLLPGRASFGHHRPRLAVHRDRPRHELHLGRAAHHAAQPGAKHTSALARRVAADLTVHGWRLERVLSDNGSEFRSAEFGAALSRVGARQTFIWAGRAATQRRRRARPADPARGVPAAGLRSEPGAQAHRLGTRPLGLPALLQRGARPHRSADPGPDTAGDLDRCPQMRPR